LDANNTDAHVFSAAGRADAHSAHTVLYHYFDHMNTQIQDFNAVSGGDLHFPSIVRNGRISAHLPHFSISLAPR
jgi:hypothetical protein